MYKYAQAANLGAKNNCHNMKEIEAKKFEMLKYGFQAVQAANLDDQT